MATLFRFLKQPSTWRGIAWLLTVLGVSLSTEQWKVIGAAGVAIVAVIEMFTDEDKRPRDINLPPIETQSKSEDVYVRNGIVHRKLHINMPTDHIAGSQYDERQNGFNDQ